MPHARDRIRYPHVVATQSEDYGIGAREYSYRLVSTLGDVADAIESLEPRKNPAAPWPAAGKKALLEVVVQSANSVTDAFNAAIEGRSRGYIWDLPTTKVAQAKFDIQSFIYNPLAEALTGRLATTLDLDDYEKTLKRIMAELMQEIQTWKQIPDETDLVNALFDAVRAAGQKVGSAEINAITARAKELAAKGIMARDVTAKDIPAKIMAKGMGSTARPSWWKRLSGRRSSTSSV